MDSYFLSSISADAAGAIDSGNVQETVAVDQTSNVGSHDDAQGQDVQPALEQVAGGASGFSTPPVDPRTDILGDEAQGQDVDVVDARLVERRCRRRRRNGCRQRSVGRQLSRLKQS